jgi:hypothetical protein
MRHLTLRGKRDSVPRNRPADPSDVNCFSGGTQQYDDGVVEVRTAVEYSFPMNPVGLHVEACTDSSKMPVMWDDGITIRLKCKKKPHLLQFVSYEIIDADGKRLNEEVPTDYGSIQTTTDPEHRIWMIDTGDATNPYYEAKGIHRSDPGELRTFDQPTFLEHRDPGEIQRQSFKAYAICNGRVVREITWSRQRKQGSEAVYTVHVMEADELPRWARDKLLDAEVPGIPRIKPSGP